MDDNKDVDDDNDDVYDDNDDVDDVDDDPRNIIKTKDATRPEAVLIKNKLTSFR